MVVELRLRVFADGKLQRQEQNSLHLSDIISETPPFSQRVDPESGILTRYSVVHQTEHQGARNQDRYARHVKTIASMTPLG